MTINRDKQSAPARARRLRDAGLKATGPRLAILAALESDRTHPSVEQLHARLAAVHPSLSLSTVYSALEAFAEAGLIRKISGAEGRLRVDGTNEDHDHAICLGCGEIFDIDRDRSAPGRSAERLPRGLRLLRVRVEYEVMCPACEANGGESRRAASDTTS